ncbi:hypothetical protein [Cellulomonas sp. SLBN-39]|uniref:hypothetical protein n=1 Tax=Cellulomonas sp. SLBN-39 TaxID=2768446 RepID=UPI0011669B67|nr:hypothetical protein [Cellulomonas sp. SLBN-39]TQL01337.1 hypothetical protein FBY24_0385 [Cellulomonas sp. SLBN-39]
MSTRRPPRGSRRARGSRRTPLAGCLGVAGAVLGGVALVAVGATAVVALLDEVRPAAVAEPRCTAHLDGTDWTLTPDQAQNAALIAALGVRRDLPARAVTIALATALQESRLENIDYGDRDSVGLFQQRPSQGWGTVEQIMDPVYSTTRFYDGLVEVPGYEDLEVTVAAQAVQRSGFPDAYAQHEVRSRAWASALTGHSPAAVTCVLPGAASATEDVAARLARDLGDLPTTAVPGSEGGAATVDVDATSLDPADAVRAGWAAAQWAVAVAQPTGVDLVAVGDHVWDRTAGAWSTVEDGALPPGQVRLTLAG